MKISVFNHVDNWQDVKNATMNTIGKEKGVYPDSFWKMKLLRAEHSPIRKLKFSWRWSELPYWVSTHFVRHKIGIEHFVKTQRTDRTGINRDELPQGAFVSHECEADAQALINISRKRLCRAAAAETREAWQLVKNEVAKVEPELASCMVRECIYRGHCPEMFGCGFDKTEEFQTQLAMYRNLKGFITHNGYTVAITTQPRGMKEKSFIRCYLMQRPFYDYLGQAITDFDLPIEGASEKAIKEAAVQYMDSHFIANGLRGVFESHGQYVAVWKYEDTVADVKEAGYDGEPLVDENGELLADDDIAESGVVCFVYKNEEDIRLNDVFPEHRCVGSLAQFNFVSGDEIGDVADLKTWELKDLIDREMDSIEAQNPGCFS